MQYIYLDWNVVQYMKNSIIRDSINGPEFEQLIKKLSKKYQFPFSEGHLRDLAISFKPENRHYIESDLKYLNEVSGGYALGIYDTVDTEEKLRTTNQVNISIFFEQIISETDKEPTFQITGNSYNIDMSSLQTNDLFSELNNGILDVSVMQAFLQKLWQENDNPSFYKEFRNHVANLKKKFESSNTVLNKESNYFKKIVPFLDFLTLNDISKLENQFNDILRAFLSINGRENEKLKVGQKIEIAYYLLDFHPNFRDKINQKNRPSNIGRDCKHLFFASQAKYYVSEDKATLKKATFVSKALSLKVKVLNMSEFSSKFC